MIPPYKRRHHSDFQFPGGIYHLLKMTFRCPSAILVFIQHIGIIGQGGYLYFSGSAQIFNPCGLPVIQVFHINVGDSCISSLCPSLWPACGLYAGKSLLCREFYHFLQTARWHYRCQKPQFHPFFPPMHDPEVLLLPTALSARFSRLHRKA